MIAGKAAGIYDDLVQVAYEHAQPAGDPAHPDQEHHQRYMKRVDNYILLQATLADTFREFSN
jgi:ribulose kinase